MRKHLSFGLSAGALLLIPPTGFAYQQPQSQPSQQPSSAQPPAQPAAQTPQTAPAQTDSLVAAARRTREEKKDKSKPAKVFPNENLPDVGGISSVGEFAAPGENGAAADANPPAANAAPANDEKTWRAKFATLHHKLEQDEQELDVMQRELGVLDVQYYANPLKSMQQDLTREDINKKTSDIDAKKQKIEADKQAISDAEDDLRKAGGDSGWAR